ncbi:histidine kinase dimerization/phosphoacceptor domain -containing protein [Mucilaginibacter sp.]|uniref:tetratricopeptide repeat-containing sensor histidine kinase n=1 Tax=Mucilaginibacter sp. TaxID=1882438 RepID=UPI002616F002|nr:histidine kinase dimerization/phosphoacceptor domain -containing protein [Mucilaginibacter sp.]MDB4922959.1 histidine kinase [Mucilaginibacter sp.]
MRKLFTAVMLLFTLYLNAKAQNASSADSTRQLLFDLKKTTSSSERLKILIKLGGYYLYKLGEFKSDLDSADLFLNQASTLGATLKSSKIQNKVSFLKAEVLFERGDQPKARTAYLQAIDNYMRSGGKEEAAQAWISIAVRTMYSEDSTVMRGLHGFEHALNIYTELHNKEKEADVLKYIGDELLRQGKLDEAENELLKALSIYKSIGYKKLHYTYDLLASISNVKGNFNKALYYSLEMIKSVQATSDTAQAYVLYLKVGAVYKNLNEDEKSKYWIKRAMINGAKDPELFYSINNSLISLMIKEGKKKEALEFLLKLIKKRPPTADWEKLKVATKLGECYSLLGKDDLAEKYYQQAVAIAERESRKYDGLIAYKRMADFYFSRKRYIPAGIYLHKVLAVPRGIGEVETIRDTYLKLFKTDSVTGNYLSAIKNYQRYKSLTDSIFTVAKAKQIAELQLQYEKDQKVQQLENKGKLQQVKLQHAGTVRNFTIAGAGLLFLSLVLGYRRYRQKQHNNRLLQAQQQEISLINQSLQVTVAEKDSLLIEKDWLLREVNHRVKNNLHMVISLLESQAMYLENDALKAMETSKHRIFSMSLIHQKLYQSDDVKTIDMSVCLPELVNYLRDSFDAGKYIHFSLEVDPVQLSVSQAIPLALVLNEAITNSVKYAFPGNRRGEISIKMRQTNENIELIIRDNGIGMVKATEDTDIDSLGLKLMRGLIEEISGQIQFENKNGTIIRITFKIDLLVEKSPILN